MVGLGDEEYDEINVESLADGPSITPDKMILSVQMVYDIDLTYIQDSSASTQHILKYIFTQYSLKQGLQVFQDEEREAMDAEF